MIEQEFILLIMNCKKYVKKAVFQKMTWLKKIPNYLKYYHVIGDETLESDFKFNEEERILWVKTPDDYNSLPKKVIAAYNAVNIIFNYKYILKTDDDQILVKDNFFNTITKLIKNAKPKLHYGGYIVDIQVSHLSQYNKIHPELPKFLPMYPTKYCSGRFYFLSKNAIDDLISKKEKITSEYFEDYAIGYNLSDAFKSNILNISTNKIFTDIELSDFPKLLEENKI
jgi:hypothetical protein